MLKQSPAQGSRYTITRPLTALIGICLPSAIGAFAVGAPLWIGASFAIAGLLVLAVHLSTYIYCVINDRDAIRKETFTINPPAIERSLVAQDLASLSIGNAGFIDESVPKSLMSDVKQLEPQD